MTRIEKLPVKIHTAVASRLKLMARLDIGEKRLPQDGRIDYQLGSNQLDMRLHPARRARRIGGAAYS